MKNISTWYMTFGEWMFKLFILNFLWVLFTIAGIGVLGIFPATIALYATIRKELQSEHDIKIFSSFISYFKREFLKANLYGYSVTIAGALLFFNIRVLAQLPSTALNAALTLFTYALIIVLSLIAIYLPPLYVHFELKFLTYFKYAIILIIGKPLQTFMMIVVILVLLVTFYYLPVLFPVLGASTLSYFIMKISLPLFDTGDKTSTSA
ncbi:YesL family protein [Gracilibacillus xinjiangensis]|uniref:YesL family protein n=1 Tax=Gracilibacillus xinjiangensis TaxID=1193282 RepID=A0ABV8WUE9_9BACI